MSLEAAPINDYRRFLADILATKKARKPAFSLRSFARLLAVSPAQLSKILAYKQPLSSEMAVRFADQLALSPAQRAAFLESVLGDLGNKNPAAKRQLAWHVLEDDRFRMISDWYHLAILSLGALEDNEASPAWIARRLALTEKVAQDAFERLRRLDLITIEGGRFRQAVAPFQTTTDVPSTAIRSYHRQTLELAADRLESVPVDQREYTSFTVAIDPSRMVEAKAAMRAFKNRFAAKLEDGAEKTEVYTFAMQFFPLTQSTPQHRESP